MGFLHGLIGAILGIIVGFFLPLLFLYIVEKGDSYRIFFPMLLLGPIGMVIGAIVGIIVALRVLE